MQRNVLNSLCEMLYTQQQSDIDKLFALITQFLLNCSTVMFLTPFTGRKDLMNKMITRARSP